MTEEKYTVVESKNNSEWDEFLLKTENKNIYSTSEFIENSSSLSKKFFIKKNNEIFASFHLFVKGDIIEIGDRIYSPLNFKLFEKQNLSSIKYKKFEIIEVYANFVRNNFKSGEICLDFNTNDLRPFYWINFNEKKEIFKTKLIKYTSTLYLKDKLTFSKIDDIASDLIYKNFSRSLKQQITKSTSENFHFKEEFDIKFFEATLINTYNNQGKTIDFDMGKLKKVYEMLFKKNNLLMFSSIKNKKKLSYCIFGIIGDNAIYLNGGRVENNNDDTSLTHNFIMSLLSLKKAGISTVDLEGINSPKRGFWKLSFGGDIKPYYHLIF